jgi:glycosyltransferase involved in cell wall biosynthesis
VIASARHPIREPFAGGLEAHTWLLVRGLRRRGHEVSLFAAAGSDPSLSARMLEVSRLDVSAAASRDVSMPAEQWLGEHHGYLTLMLQLMNGDAGQFDIVHNNSLHHLPVAMARALRTPVVTTLHTPPTPWLESAIAAGPCPVTFAAVSRGTAAAWAHTVRDPAVIPNGIDVGAWPPGPGGGPLIWFGRMVHEKGPDLAIDAARQAGIPLQLAGPISDPAFFEQCVQPRLGADATYLGHLAHTELAAVVGQARATLVTPRWDEPYGLVAAESLACGTPVIGFARGGLPEIVDADCAALVLADDVDALAAAARTSASLSRAAARRRALSHCAARDMIQSYERLYLSLIQGRP